MDILRAGARVAAGKLPERPSRPRSAAKVYLGIARWSMYLLFLLLPLFFLPWNLEILEVNKQTLLVLLTFVGAIAWLGSMIASRTLLMKRGWLNLFPFVLILSVLVSTILSQGGFVSWVGESSQEYTSFLTFAAFGLMFYLVVNLSEDKAVQKSLFCKLLVSSVIAGLIGLSSIYKFYLLPFDFAKVQTFNTVGTLNSLATFLAVMTVFACGLWLAESDKFTFFRAGWKGIAEKAGIFLLSFVTLLVLATVNYWPLYLVLLFGLLLTFAFSITRAKEFRNTTKFVLPMILFVLSLLMIFVNFPFRMSVPAEVTPSLKASWSIAKDSLGGASALFGTGPGTYVFDYAKFHSQDVNTTSFWNVRFDRASSHVLTILPTLGVLTFAFWLLFVAYVAGRALSRVIRGKAPEEWLGVYVLLPAFASVVFASFLYSSNMTLTFLFFGFAGLLAAELMKKSYAHSFGESPRLGLSFSFLFVLLAIAIVSVLFVTGQRYAAELAFAKAVRLDRSGADVQQIVEKLDQAATYNRYNDVYYRNLSSALLTRVSEELGKLSTDQATTQEQSQYIQALTVASINSSVRATTLAPNNVLNWSIRGAIYREFAPIIGNAGDFATASFEEAKKLEPMNPSHPTELGITYLVMAELKRQMTAAEDEAVAAQATSEMQGYLSKAETELLHAIELKSDYAPAHYQLAIVYERQGRLSDAIGKMESVARYNPYDVGVAFQLGLLYLRRGGEKDLDNAQMAFEYSVQLLPSYSNAMWFLAAIYEQKGMVDAATQLVAKVYELNPTNELVKSRLDRLKSGEVSVEIPPTVEEGEDTATEVPEGQPVEEPAAETTE